MYRKTLTYIKSPPHIHVNNANKQDASKPYIHKHNVYKIRPNIGVLEVPELKSNTEHFKKIKNFKDNN